MVAGEEITFPLSASPVFVPRGLACRLCDTVSAFFRREDPIKAAAADVATWNAWSGHPSRHRIENRDEQGLVLGLQEKLDSMARLVHGFLSQPRLNAAVARAS